MLPLAILPASLKLDHFCLDGTAVTLFLRTTNSSAVCPACGQLSSHAHSRYVRRLHDLPLQGRTTLLELTVRRFFCRNSACPRKVFAEPIPDLACPHARSTSRLNDAHRAVALSLGGEAGSRLAGKLAMPISPDSLLRRIIQATATAEPAPPPRVVGVDDWALRRGHRYGTVIVDLQRRRVLDLLPGRDGSGLQKWLAEHPGIEVISRDRASAYSQAAHAAAPNAVQVADRWHLLKNLREMLERFLDCRRQSINEVARQMDQPLGATAPAMPLSAEPERAPQGPDSAAAATPAPSPREQSLLAKRQQRLQRYEQVRLLHRQGVPIRQIARQMELSREAVRGYIRQEHCPDWRPGQPRRTKLNRHSHWIDQRLHEGCHNAVQLHQELTTRGYAGSYGPVRRFVSRRLAALGIKREKPRKATPPKPTAPSARTLAFEVIRQPAERKPEEQARLAILAGINEEFREVLAGAEEFAAMLRKQTATTLKDWLAKATQAKSDHLRGFAKGIQQDEAAVAAAITEPWSNGPVEGAVNRLKLIKREMFGRASFELLRRRVLHRG